MANPNQDNLDDEFKRYAEQVARDEADRKNRGNGGSYEFEMIKWTGLSKPADKKMTILRALGGTPNMNKTPFNARTVRISQIVCDDKKTRRFILPAYEDNKGFFLWRLINKVLEVTWDKDKKKVYVNETAHPAVFQMIENNSFPVGSMQQKTTYGWSGRDMFLLNCIDRSQMAWHKENKHSMLLSKEVRKWTAPDGKALEFPEQGVPSYGFVQVIAAELFAFYGNWNNYDIGIERTGQMNVPYRIINCEKNSEKITPNEKKLVVSGPLTDEEKSWELYDLNKLFNVSSYTKYWNHLRNNIQSVDVAFGTHFHSELKSLMEDEKKRRAEEKAAGKVEESEEDEAPSKENPLPAPIELRSAPVQNQPQTHCVEDLPPAERARVDTFGFDEKTGKFVITFKGNESLVGCLVCQTPSPKSFTKCPKCGTSF
jgi:hypothetical protein